MAVCELAGQLIEADADHQCSAPRAACQACIGSFEPTLSDPNPVVASLAYSAAEAWLAELDRRVEDAKRAGETGTDWSEVRAELLADLRAG